MVCGHCQVLQAGPVLLKPCSEAVCLCLALELHAEGFAGAGTGCGPAAAHKGAGTQAFLHTVKRRACTWGVVAAAAAVEKGSTSSVSLVLLHGRASSPGGGCVTGWWSGLPAAG